MKFSPQLGRAAIRPNRHPSRWLAAGIYYGGSIRGDALQRRIKPIELRAQFNFGPGPVTDGVLNIYPRPGSLQHPVGGHFYLGDTAHPFTGRIDGLHITRAPTSPQGRPPKTARDMGVKIAYDSLLRCAVCTLPKVKAQTFAKNQCLDLWSRWPGIQEAAALRTARRNAGRTLAGTTGAMLTYTGTAPDLSDYVAVLALPGATHQTHAGRLRINGPAWVWRWGEETAERFDTVQIEVSIPGAIDTALVTL